MKQITTLHYITTLLVCVCTINCYAYNKNKDITHTVNTVINTHEDPINDTYKETVTKTINRHMNVNNNALLEIKNQFGNIFITEGNNNTITFSITITAKSSTLKGAQDIADRINIEFSESKSKVSAKTTLTSNNNGNGGMEINYNVTVPSSVFLQLNNKFGNVYLKDCKQDLNANIEFGDIGINSLKADNNKINLKFGKLKLEQAKSLNLDISHSTSEIGDISLLNCTSAFSSIQIESIDVLNCPSFKHGNISIISANRIEIPDLQFSETTINQLVKSLTVKDLKFGQLKIENIDNSFENISVFAKHGDVNMNLSPKTSCKVDLSTKMGGINIKGFKNLKVENIDRNGFEKACSGTIGKKTNPTGFINVTNQHANINLNNVE